MTVGDDYMGDIPWLWTWLALALAGVVLDALVMVNAVAAVPEGRWKGPVAVVVFLGGVVAYAALYLAFNGVNR